VSRTTTARRLGIIATAALAGAAVAAPSALGAVVPVEDGQTDLHLNAATATALGDLGVGVAPPSNRTSAGKAFRSTRPIGMPPARLDPNVALRAAAA